MDFSSIIAVSLQGSLDVIRIASGSTVLWEKGETDYSKLPFFIQNDTNDVGTVTFTKTGSANFIMVSTSVDNVTWSVIGSPTTLGITAMLPANGRLYVKCNTNKWGNSTSAYNKITSDVRHSVCGNIMSLLYGDYFEQYTTFSTAYTFFGLFYGDEWLQSAEHLLLLPNNLTTSCYRRMFYNCFRLAKAPELPATTLTTGCYAQMFYGCSSLDYVKALFTSGWTSSITNSWLYGVSPTGTLVLSGGNHDSLTSGESGVPDGWNVGYTYLTSPTISQVENTVTVALTYGETHYYAKQYYAIDGGTPVLITGSEVTFDISADCVVTAWEEDDTGFTSEVSSHNAVYTDYEALPMFFQNETNTEGTVTFRSRHSEAPSITVYTSTDNSTWTSIGHTSTSGITATLPANGRLYVRATANQWGKSTTLINYITCDVEHSVRGNILSLLYGSAFYGKTEIKEYNYTFYGLFNDFYTGTNSTLVDASRLVIKASNLRTQSLASLFSNCVNLKTSPVLDSISVKSASYNALVSMFSGCSTLNNITALFNPSEGSYTTNGWVSNVSSSGTFVKSSGYSWATGDSGIPTGWTVVNV